MRVRAPFSSSFSFSAACCCGEKETVGKEEGAPHSHPRLALAPTLLDVFEWADFSMELAPPPHHHPPAGHRVTCRVVTDQDHLLVVVVVVFGCDSTSHCRQNPIATEERGGKWGGEKKIGLREFFFVRL